MTTQSGPQTASPPEPGFGPGITRRQAYLTFAIVSLALLMSTIDNSIISVGIPTLMTDLQTNLAYIAWVITGYGFSQIIIMPIIGKLSDEFGRKRLFMTAVFLFTFSSIAAGFSPNIYWLIIFRVIQGIGAGVFLPSAAGIIADTFGRKRSIAIGLFSSIAPIGTIIGPNIGGLIIAHLSWRWLFFVNVPIGILLIVSGLMILPGGRASSKKLRIDFGGMGIFALAMLSILFGMTAWADSPLSVPFWIWPLFAVGIILLVIFAFYENRMEQPAIELRLLKEKSFLAANLYNFMFGASVFGIFSFFPYYAVTGYQMTAIESGLILTPRSVVSIIVAAFISFLMSRLGYRKPMIIGSLIISAGLIILSLGNHDVSVFGWPLSNVVYLSIIMALSGIGMGFANPVSNNAMLDQYPEKAAAVTGLRGTFRFTGGLMGTTIIALVLSHYQDQALGMQHCYLAFAGLLVLTLPLIFLIPEMSRRGRNKD